MIMKITGPHKPALPIKARRESTESKMPARYPAKARTAHARISRTVIIPDISGNIIFLDHSGCRSFESIRWDQWYFARHKAMLTPAQEKSAPDG